MLLRILQIEDSDSDAALNIRALEKAGFEVSCQIVCTGEDMKRAIAHGTFDIVLSDHNMPQFDSASALAIYKKMGLDIPFIIVSGAIGEETAVGLMKSGAHDYVMKQNLARLAPAVERELREAEIRRQRKKMQVQIEELYQKEKIQRQKLEEEARVKNLFIDVLAHELRNSMTSLVISSDTLQGNLDLKDELKGRLIKNINESSRLLTKRLDELLDLARYSKGTFVLKREDVEAPDFLEQVISHFTPSLEKRSQRLLVEIDPELNIVNIDRSRIEQVVTNLLSNASKYSPDHSDIVLKAGLVDNALTVQVADKGIGIPPEDQNKLFQPYYRACKNQGIPGIGLGLAVSSKIVEAHGGSIRVTSQLGKGSEFSILIPNARTGYSSQKILA